jgi:hypothetical protein
MQNLAKVADQISESHKEDLKEKISERKSLFAK